jgi:hypothetical protein
MYMNTNGLVIETFFYTDIHIFPHKICMTVTSKMRSNSPTPLAYSLPVEVATFLLR